MTIQTYRDLRAWQLGMEFAVRVYELTKILPREELYGLSAQLRRAAVAIPSNVAEGHQHRNKSYRHHVVIAIGSLAEVETQLELAQRLKLAADDDLAPIRDVGVELRRVLHGLRRSIAPRPEPR